jgi:hypothetical protein
MGSPNHLQHNGKEIDPSAVPESIVDAGMPAAVSRICVRVGVSWRAGRASATAPLASVRPRSSHRSPTRIPLTRRISMPYPVPDGFLYEITPVSETAESAIECGKSGVSA